MVTESQKRAAAKWNKENLKQINLALRIEEYNQLKEYCAKVGIATNTYIRQLIQSDINKTDQSLPGLIGYDLYKDFIDVLTNENADLSTILKNAISKYIDKHKQTEPQ